MIRLTIIAMKQITKKTRTIIPNRNKISAKIKK